ncbi:hypothetical protein D3C80_1634760 [compost metagenome]
MHAAVGTAARHVDPVTVPGGLEVVFAGQFVDQRFSLGTGGIAAEGMFAFDADLGHAGVPEDEDIMGIMPAPAHWHTPPRQIRPFALEWR